MTIDLTEILIAIIGMVFLGVIIPAVKALIVWLKSKTKNEGLQAAFDEAGEVAENVIAGLNATIVKEMRAQSADGKLSKEDAKIVMDKAVEAFLSDVSTKTRETIEANADDMTAWIANLIEQRLTWVK